MLITRRHSTALGSVSSTWTAKGLYSVAIGDDPSRLTDRRDANDSNVDPWEIDESVIDTFDRQMVDYCRTGQGTFDDVVVDPTGWTPFMQRVYQCCRQIQPGDTMTYKQLAAAAGNEKASRAVGAAMSRNRILLVIPCHRVLAANGQLRGFSAPGGLATKQSLLDLENCVESQPLFAADTATMQAT